MRIGIQGKTKRNKDKDKKNRQKKKITGRRKG